MSVLFSDPRILFSSGHFYFLLRVFSIIYAFNYFFNGWDFFLFCTKQRKEVLNLFNTEIVPWAKFSYEKISVSTILTQDIHTREFNKLKATLLGSILQRGVRTNFFLFWRRGTV